jgi:hypothetical protein
MVLIVAPRKVQKQSPFSYLGQLIEGRTICPQKIEIRKDNLKTLNDFQKFYRETLNHLHLDISHRKVVWPWLRLNKLPTNNEQLFHLFHELRALLQQHSYFVGHLQSHSGLPGPLAEGNRQADALVSPLILHVDTSSPVNQAIQSHSQFH